MYFGNCTSDLIFFNFGTEDRRLKTETSEYCSDYLRDDTNCIFLFSAW